MARFDEANRVIIIDIMQFHSIIVPLHLQSINSLPRFILETLSSSSEHNRIKKEFISHINQQFHYTYNMIRSNFSFSEGFSPTSRSGSTHERSVLQMSVSGSRTLRVVISTNASSSLTILPLF